jgi:hypothetical protein
MSDNKSQLATFRVEPELWDAFKAQARKNGKTASDVLNEFVQSYVKAGIPVSNAPRLDTDNLDSHIDEKIAPLRAELDEIKAALAQLPGKQERAA